MYSHKRLGGEPSLFAENRNSLAGAPGDVPGMVMAEGCGNRDSNQASQSDFHGREVPLNVQWKNVREIITPLG